MNGLDQLAQFPTVFWFRNPIFNFGANWRIKYRFGAECRRNVGIQAVSAIMFIVRTSVEHFARYPTCLALF